MSNTHIGLRKGKVRPPETDSDIYGWLYHAYLNLIADPLSDIPSQYETYRPANPINPRHMGIHAHKFYNRYGLLARNMKLYREEQQQEIRQSFQNYQSPIRLMWESEAAFSSLWFEMADFYACLQRKNAPRYNFSKDFYIDPKSNAQYYVREKARKLKQLEERINKFRSIVKNLENYAEYHKIFTEE